MNRTIKIGVFVFFLLCSRHIQANSDPAAGRLERPAANSTNTATGTTRPLTILPPGGKTPVRIAKFSTPPIIDGKLEDEAWKTAPVMKDFLQISPGDNIPSSKPTEVRLGYDEKNLYISFKCYDERDKIRATVAARDDVFGEDNVRIWLDTYNDQRRAYVLGFNPLGIQQDGIYTEGQGADFSVDIVMESKGVIEDWGWSVEVKVPFKSLRYSAGKNKFWGFNLWRVISRLNNETDSWMPEDKNVSGMLIQFGKITNLENIKTERTLEVVPTITISESGSRARTVPQSVAAREGILDAGKFVNLPVRLKPGATIKLGITPNITLDAAINPDFAEIEADAPIVAANQRFPVFFQEKRPFFLENEEIFQSPLQIFYSRTIVSPEAAVKLSGKSGKTSFGILAASDKAAGNYSDEERRDPAIRFFINKFLDKNASLGVIRLKRDIGKENNIGFFGAYRSFPEQHNAAAGFDGKFKLNPRTVTSFQIIGTTSRRCFFDPAFEPSLDPAQAQQNLAVCSGYLNPGTYDRYRTGNGFGYFASFSYSEKNRGFYAESSGRTKDYRADLGFTRRTDTNNIYLSGALNTESKPKSKIIRVLWQPFIRINYNWRGGLQDEAAASNLDFVLQHNTSLHFEGGYQREKLIEEEFGLKRSPTRTGAFFGAPQRSATQPFFGGSFSAAPGKRISLSFFIRYTRNVFDLDFGAGNRFPRVSPAALAGSSALDPGAADQFDLQFHFETRPIDSLLMSFDYNKRALRRNDTKLEAFDSNIFTLRSTFQFTRFIFTRLRADYNSLASNVSGQMLFGWNPNPGTSVYAGYGDNLNYNGFNPYSGQFEPYFVRNNRVLFVRASYLFRKSF